MRVKVYMTQSEDEGRLLRARSEMCICVHTNTKSWRGADKEQNPKT